MVPENAAGFWRLFTAIEVPEAVRQTIGRAQGRLRRDSPPGAVRWTREDQFHLTLKFLGDVPMAQVPTVETAMKDACDGFAALQLSARRIGFFPNARKPRVIWVGATDAAGQLAELHRRLDEALRALAPEERREKFVGHVTLGRFKPGFHGAIPRLVEAAENFREQSFGDWRAQEVVLVRSELESAGAEYTTVAAGQLVNQ